MALCALAGAMFLWSGTFIAMRVALTTFHPMLMVFSGLMCLAFGARLPEAVPAPEPLLALAFLSFSTVVAYGLYTLGIARIGEGPAAAWIKINKSHASERAQEASLARRNPFWYEKQACSPA